MFNIYKENKEAVPVENLFSFLKAEEFVKWD